VRPGLQSGLDGDGPRTAEDAPRRIGRAVA
jgi:hypothetical protein